LYKLDRTDMKRNIITISESGNIIMPNNITDIWMSEPELMELFGVIAPALRATVRAIYKSGALKEYDVQKYIRLENGYHADVFSLTMIVALAFRINSFGAEQMRNAILKRMYLRKEKTTFFFSLGSNGTKVSNYQA
jgi:Virulence protein